ncbi:AAA family ATPase [Burkholderia cenocepacia]|uniref:AAA family ATPase n=1 Tax=Burkholderia cenocepacia TaxID=95486 RepID=UPI000D0BEC44|nr:conserved hypothetical protein [Burkholderia cenocepacia]
MRVQLKQLRVHTRKTTEIVPFSPTVTFLHGPIGKGKSSVARLIDFCLGGSVERTPAIQREFISADLLITLGTHHCIFERATDSSRIRVTWEDAEGNIESLNAPLEPEDSPLLEGTEVFNLSDLIFHLCDVTPIKVRRSSRDPESPLIRLSFRDLMWYCYLDQTHLDSSFFRLEDAFRGRKSQDAMRFFTGLHSERLSQLDALLMKKIDAQRGKREAVLQIRAFMSQFGWDSDLNISGQISEVNGNLRAAEAQRATLEKTRVAEIHPTDTLRKKLRRMGWEIAELAQAIAESEQSVGEQKSLRAELITAKIKADRTQQASEILGGVNYHRCPQCGTDVEHRTPPSADHCHLCCSDTRELAEVHSALEVEAFKRDLNDRIDQIAESITRRTREIDRSLRDLARRQEEKSSLDRQLQAELTRYDSAYVESVRDIDRRIATLRERSLSLQKLQKMPEAINALEIEAGALQGEIDNLRSAIDEERMRLKAADDNIAKIAEEFKRILIAVSFPGIYPDDYVVINPRNWSPVVVNKDLEWGFWDTGSGGKKTAFNVCYALAVHSAARQLGLPVPGFLVIDSPTKNIDNEENPDLVRALYDEIYQLATEQEDRPMQFLLIDSHLVEPQDEIPDFIERRMAGEPDAPSLISYYDGP